MIIGWFLTGGAILVAIWAALEAFAAWRQARRRRLWGQWGHLALLVLYVVVGGYLVVSLGSAIIAAHS